MRRSVTAALALALMLGAAGWWSFRAPPALTPEARAALFRTPLPAPEGAMAVFHLGHSLVGRDMPAMVEQLAAAAGIDGHSHHSQLGWGSTLRDHWDPARAIHGFETENAHPRFRDPREALAQGVDALVLTEMVSLADAIRFHQSPRYLANWARLARQYNPDTRVFLYETWHHWSADDAWLNRLEQDADTQWEGIILAQAMAQDGVGAVHVIPAGRVLGAFVRALEAQGGLPGLADRTGLFARGQDGQIDSIHLGDLGNYLVALVHLATLYHVDPRGLPHALMRHDGSSATAPSPQVAALMQATVWDVVRALPVTGVPAG